MGSLRTRDCIRVEKDQRKVLNLIERAFQWKLGAAGRVASARMEWAAARVDDFDDMLLARPGPLGYTQEQDVDAVHNMENSLSTS